MQRSILLHKLLTYLRILLICQQKYLIIQNLTKQL
nr:MAG TPA: hypothetical protein [Bacteriophage sp.]